MKLLEIDNLSVSVEGKKILKGVSLTVEAGRIHALMGPNGSGKSTLSYALAGHPKYKVESGRVLLAGEDLLAMPADMRARKGLFLAFQYPVAVPGVSLANFLRSMVRAMRGADMPVKEFRAVLKAKMEILGVDEKFMGRYINEGFSGGEKKRCEILQMAMAEPKMAVLDETDSGLDIDALRTVALGINKVANANNGMLLITHYQRILDYVKPHVVHVFYDGRIITSGGPELAKQLEVTGYAGVIKQHTGEEVQIQEGGKPGGND